MTGRPTYAELADALRASLTENERLQTAGRGDRSAEPVAIVGMSCRFPGGADSPAAFWDLLHAGRETVSDFPTDRGWDLDRLLDADPERPGTTSARQGSFLESISGFDAAFFGISPREALAMDPQQRLLLEVTWEALEDAGIDPRSLAGTSTGTFAGLMHQDYGAQAGGGMAPPELVGHLGLGRSASVASGRIAYTLGLTGAAVSIDAACASSLVALHLAKQALNAGECSLVLVAGVTVLSEPQLFVEFARQGVLSADGRCRAFAERADGTGFSEGAGVLVLERMSDARAGGRRVLGLLRGSAVNQDGASNGLTAPSGPAQERVIRQALADAQLSPADVDAVEAHGTGTALGDPIEAHALLRTYGQQRDRPLLLGSAKSNIGHAQAAAGVAGVIKMLLAMRHSVLPRTLHAERPSPHIDWSAGDVKLLTESAAWARGDRPRRAGISSFGVSGTNAHVILEEPPLDERSAGTVPPAALPLVLSATSADGLDAQAQRLHEQMLGHPDAPAVDVAWTLATGRATFEHRAVVVGVERDDLLARTRALARGEAAPRVVRGRARRDARPVFVFPGHGTQWSGMAVELLDASSVFADHIGRCEAALNEFVPWSLEDVLRGRARVPDARSLDIVQPALFGVMVALARLWESFGVRPSTVIGHSQGEVAAAHIAGGLSLRDAAMIVVARSRALCRIAGAGGMATVSLDAASLGRELRRWEGRLSLASINGPAASVVSGENEALAEFLSDCQGRGVRTRRIADCPGHSAQVDALRETFVAALASIAPRSGDIPFVSTVEEGVIPTTRLDGSYWYRNLRETVRLAPAVRALADRGVREFIEISPHPVLVTAITETVETLDRGGEVAVMGSLRRGDGGMERFAAALGEAWVRGIAVDWRPLFDGAGARTTDVPTYAFARDRYWLEPRRTDDVASAGLEPTGHPLLTAAVGIAGSGSLLLTGRLSRSRQPWLSQHTWSGTCVLPALTMVDMALHAAAAAGCDRLDELTIHAPIVVPPEGALDVQIVVAAPSEGRRRGVEIHVRAAGDGGEWTLHARAIVADAVVPASPQVARWPPPGAVPIDVDELRDALAEQGWSYGPLFSNLRAAWRLRDGVCAEAEPPPSQPDPSGPRGLGGTMFETAIAGALMNREGGHPVFVSTWTGVQTHRPASTATRILIRQAAGGKAGVTVFDSGGALVASADAVGTQPLPRLGLSRGSEALFEVQWAEVADDSGDDGAGQAAVAVLGAALDAVAGGDRFDDLDGLIADLGEERPAPQVVLACAHRPDGGAALDAARALDLLQRFLAEPHLDAARLVLVTIRGIAAAVGDLPDLTVAAVWGLVRAAQCEHPGRVAVVDVDGGDVPWPAIVRTLCADEPQLAVRDGRLLVPRVVPWAPVDEAPAQELDPCGTVVITGGTRGIGAAVARHLAAEHGARHLLLLSRSGPGADGVAELVSELARLGCDAVPIACDVSDRHALSTVLRRIPAERPLRAVVHCAAVLADGLVERLTSAQLDAVLRPKAVAATNLHELTAGCELTHFILFSSVAGVLGSPGQANYSAANTVLDALAARRRAEGLPATSIAWGLWTGAGALSGEDTAADVERLSRITRPLTTERGLALLDLALRSTPPLVIAARLDRAHLRATAAQGGLPPVLRGLVPPGPTQPVDDRSPRERLTAAGDADAAALQLVTAELAAVLGHRSAAAIERDRELADLGLESLGALELRNRLADRTGLRLPSDLLLDHRTPAAVAERLVQLAVTGRKPRLPAVPGSPPLALTTMLESARALGTSWEFLSQLMDASQRSPSFSSPAEVPGHGPRRLANGGTGPVLVCLASIIAVGGPHEYAKLAAALGDDRDVAAFPWPGFERGESLPATFEAAIELQASAVAAYASGRELVLLGHSSGGLLAQAVTARLERAGTPPAGLLLLDPPPLSALRELDRDAGVTELLFDGDRLLGAVTDTRLVAMAAYIRLFREWQPPALTTPTCVLRAEQPLAWRTEASWPGAEVIVVAGSHMSMMDEHVAGTAEAVGQRLAQPVGR